jgi:cobalt/nickel transport system permease protein
MQLIDEIAHTSPLRDWPPLGKLAFALSLLIVNLLARSPFVPLLLLSVGAVLMYKACDGRMPRLLWIIILDAVAIIILGGIIITLLQPGEALWSTFVLGHKVSLTEEGLNTGALVMLRAGAGLTLMMFFALSTPIPHIFVALRRLHIPKEVAELTVLIYRYTFLLLESTARMYMAANSRLGFSSKRRGIGTTAKIAAGLFIGSLDMVDRSNIALGCRNYSGEFRPLMEPAMVDRYWSAATFASCLGVYALTLLSENWLILHG